MYTFQHSGEGQRHGANGHGQKPPLEGELGRIGEVVEEFDNDELEDDGDDEDSQEQVVLVNALKHVQGFWAAGIDLIKDLTEDEGVEDDRVPG